MYNTFMKASQFLKDLRRKLAKENERILNHSLVEEAELGKMSREKLKLFATQQHHIVRYDLRSLATMLARSGNKDEAEFFHMLVAGDNEALKQLQALLMELGLSEAIEDSKLLPGAIAYTHYLSWLASYANAGEQTAALTVNLPVWGNVCKRFGIALAEKYGIKRIGFFELFAGPFDTIEKAAVKILDRYIDEYILSMENTARLIQSYELMFWDSIYKGD